MIFNTAVQRSFEYNNIPLRRSFEKIFYEYMNKLPGSGVWAPAQTPLPHSPPGKGESGVWGVGSAPHSLGGKVKVFIPQGKACLIFYLCYQTKHSCIGFSRKTFHLSHQ